MCLAWCYIYVWLLIYYVSVFICSSTDIWCKIINISCIYLHYLQSYDHLNIFIIIYWNILEYIQRWRVMLKKIFSAERVNNLYNQSTPLTFKNSTRITSEKLYEAIHLGSTSLLLINIAKYVKMSQTWPFWPWQWPLEWFNQIILFTVHCHHPGEASCQNNEKVNKQILNKWTINVKIGEKWQV